MNDGDEENIQGYYSILVDNRCNQPYNSPICYLYSLRPFPMNRIHHCAHNRRQPCNRFTYGVSVIRLPSYLSGYELKSKNELILNWLKSMDLKIHWKCLGWMMTAALAWLDVGSNRASLRMSIMKIFRLYLYPKSYSIRKTFSYRSPSGVENIV